MERQINFEVVELDHLQINYQVHQVVEVVVVMWYFILQKDLLLQLHLQSLRIVHHQFMLEH